MENRVAVVDAPPRAPSPPPQNFNVFEFLIDDSHAPSPPPLEEDTNLLDDREWESDPDDMQAERYDSGEDTYAAAAKYMKAELMKQGYAYGAQPVTQVAERFDSYTQLPISPTEGQFYTPAPSRGHQRNISNVSMDSATKESNKKRKRGHVEDLDLSRSRDVVMTDVPPVMHSGLTGGLNRMLVLPPSPPDMDGSPASPLKRTKHSMLEKERGRTREKKDKDKKSARKSGDKKEGSKDKDGKKHKSSRGESDSKAGRWERRRTRKDSEKDKETPLAAPTRRLKAIEAPRAMKAIEYRPLNGDAPETPVPSSGAVIIHPKKAIANAEHFMSFVTKGPESERGCSVNKVLKRYHRDKGRKAGGEEEKDLWKVLRLRRNDRGETVLFIEERP